MRDYLERMARYDMIFGVATADALVFGLNDKELEYGIEMDGRNRILSDFVASNYKVLIKHFIGVFIKSNVDFFLNWHKS